MKKILVIGLLLALGGCASQLCHQSPDSEACRAERLLYENDLLQAKILISTGNEEGYELARALLARSAPQDRHGETDFYQALLMIRQGPQPSEVLKQLQKAQKKGHPHAIALLYKIHHEPYLIEKRDPLEAERYRKAYAQLDVALSGYPSFEKALELVSQLVEEPPQLQPLPCPARCR
ncbi:hypothetical protein [Stutzerimonas nitrititolerans]|uniref:hypothetical protein n=1 Tax=Stutzerimonas nitrititolerans TaxID=2482751 RepID=UPI002897D6D8|nr:hypothetical protein [Stutzerimonas nitrititolerans]